ncbi:AraC family transcriptional regulator [Bacillaceae bacterium SIJ1]|uniref:AraC family transcriptional regulator n=1 Tax=Litoribacterium kuwaitense TaxID=1398745 RepID=UPI0013EC9F0C|nr:AraC family transcriptional regulator [Litoribacterium kuwaitense]NGP46380.1 AraC family transcriptional regulator [Litoribacterium kuwaitense]
METFLFHHAGDVTVRAGHYLAERQLHDFEIVYFPKGTNSQYVSECAGTFHLNAPCVLLTRPGEKHRYQFDPDGVTRHLFIHFDLIDHSIIHLYPLLGADPTQERVLFLREDSFIPQIFNQMLRYFHTKPYRWRRITQMLFLTVWEELEMLANGGTAKMSIEAPLPKPLVNALEYAENHISEKIEVGQLAAASGWSHEHFTRTFQRFMGSSPKAWLNQYKMERAAQLLLQSEVPIKQIASEVGFTDVYHFHRVFRRWSPLTASEYRKRYSDPKYRHLVPTKDWSRFYPLNHFFILDPPNDTF